ncbi:MAG: archease [Candidatus Lokiarchaeota archaeon]|nr:archease [Candidatus Lokiarchaeota archaeon]
MKIDDENSFLKNKISKIKELPHTADIKYSIKGDSLNEAFELCGYCFGLTITNLKMIKQIENIDFELVSEDLEGLLYDFISELIFLFDTKHLILSNFTLVDIKKENSAYKLKVKGKGQEFNPEIHDMGTEIKAMTYSEMKIDVDYSNFMNPVSIIVVFDI